MAPYMSQMGLDFEVNEVHKNARGVPVVLAFFVSGQVWQVTIKANGLLFRLIDNVNHDRLQDLGDTMLSKEHTTCTWQLIVFFLSFFFAVNK